LLRQSPMHTLASLRHSVLRLLSVLFSSTIRGPQRFPRRSWSAAPAGHQSLRMNVIPYLSCLQGLHNAGIEVHRKMLADLAVHDEKSFAELATVAKNNINELIS
ncbi:50S ribosomal protein L20, partial [Bacillus sp. S1-R2T1-FB]|uniref:50S ribosomal protein L20 n=1 Tax=Bacillus sp. S1-R2T1-FB TaxID=1973493 RepID=UPI0011550C35